MLRLEARAAPSRAMLALTPLLAVALACGLGLMLFALLGYAPLAALDAFFIAPIRSLRGWGELGVKATPLILCATGLAIGFRGNVWNIGAEGQLTLGAVCGSAVALAFYDEGGLWVLPLMLLAGAAGGMAWAAIPAVLRTRFQTNEILTTLMLTYVAQHLLDWAVRGPLRDPYGYGFPESRLFEDWALLPTILDGTRLHAGALFALVAAIAAWIVMSRSLFGYQVRVVGSAPRAARYAGFSEKKVVWITLLLGGGLAGLAGIVEVAGAIGQLTPSVSPGYGFTAIIVAFLGRLHALGVVPAALVMALTYLGGEHAQINLGMPQAVTGVFQGMLLFCLLGTDVLVRYRLRLGRGVAGLAAPSPTGGNR